MAARYMLISTTRAIYIIDLLGIFSGGVINMEKLATALQPISGADSSTNLGLIVIVKSPTWGANIMSKQFPLSNITLPTIHQLAS